MNLSPIIAIILKTTEYGKYKLIVKSINRSVADCAFGMLIWPVLKAMTLCIVELQRQRNKNKIELKAY